MESVNDKVKKQSTVTKTVIFDDFKIYVNSLELFKSVTLSVMLINDNDCVDTKTFILAGDDYNKWSDNDNYITEYVINALRITDV
jgi:hypothetical protein